MSFLCRRWNTLILPGGLLFSALSILAAPDNDGFASARVLPAALPVTAVGGNVEASHEEGEPRPEKSARTVWWTWTPAASGWVRITTRGTDIDTVLAAYTGSTLGGVVRQAFNDDVGTAEGRWVPASCYSGPTLEKPIISRSAATPDGRGHFRSAWNRYRHHPS